MAVDLPPALPPQLLDPAGIRAAAEAGTSTRYQRFTIALDTAPGCVDDDTLANATDGAESLSDVVRQIARACYASGYPGSQVVYARVGDTVYVSVRERMLAQVRMPKGYQGYFEGLVGESLRDHALEPRRALASVRADRDGGDLRLTWEDDPDSDGRALTAVKNADRVSGAVTPQIGNLGNRFVGRYLAALDLEQSFRPGWNLTAAARTALRSLNDDSPLRADRYNEQQIGASRVTPWGIFGLTGRFVQFDDTEDAALPFAANIEHGSLSWATVVSASFRHRLTVTSEVERIHRETELRPSGDLAFREIYTAAGLGVSDEREFLPGKGRVTLRSGVAVSNGFGDADNALTQADLGYFLTQPRVAVDWQWANEWTLGLSARAQISSDVVPEQKQWVLGGTETLHAFLPGVVAGDEGHAAMLTLTAPAWSWQSLRLTPRVFVENARAASNAPGGGSISLSDAGLGVNWTWGPRARGLLAFAEAIDDDDLTPAGRDASDANVLFAIAVDFGRL